MTNIVPISFDEFSNRGWKKYTKVNFAANDTVAMISSREVAKAILSLPIGFLKIDGAYRLVALQGLETGKNLLVDPNGSWRGGYLPKQYYCYPFLMVENENKTLILCIDEESDLVTSAEDLSAQSFFESNGEPSEPVSEIVKFLSDHATHLKATQNICAVLDQHKLLSPWPLQVQTDQGEIKLEALYRIDEGRLNSVSATALKELRNEGALAVAYAQLYSMFNIKLLVRQINQDYGSSNTMSKEIEFGITDAEGLINFDNL